jgi:hypothetical protein
MGGEKSQKQKELKVTKDSSLKRSQRKPVRVRMKRKMAERS